MITETPETLQRKTKGTTLRRKKASVRHLSAINSVLSAREGVESQAFAQLNGQDENLSATSDVCGHQFTNQQGISWILMVIPWLFRERGAVPVLSGDITIVRGIYPNFLGLKSNGHTHEYPQREFWLVVYPILSRFHPS